MKTFAKNAALLVALTCLVWIGVLWHWRSIRHEMDGRDALVYLCVLPATLFALVLAVRWAFRSALARDAAKSAAVLAAASASATGGAAANLAADDIGPAPWHLLGAWVHTAGGTSVDELLATIEAGTPRPGPDASLHDDDGLPAMTARIAELDIDAVEAELQRHADALPATLAGETIVAAPLRTVRAVAILAPLIDELVQSVRLWSEHWAHALPPPNARSAMPPLAAQSPGHDKVVRVLASWPGDWDDDTCAAAQNWLSERLSGPLAEALPHGGWSIRAQRMSGAELLAAAQRTIDLLQRERRDDPVVLIACHSDLDDVGIGTLEAAQRLFHPTRRARVSMAGEGAAVLALSALSWPADAGIDAEPVRATCPALVRRSQSVEAAGRTSSDETVELVRLSLLRASLPSAAVAKLASDADQHTARATELFAVTLALMPELDANDDFRLAGAVAGRLEAVAPLLTLACAAAQARESGRPAVALSLGDPHWRMAAVLVPESFSSAGAPA